MTFGTVQSVSSVKCLHATSRKFMIEWTPLFARQLMSKLERLLQYDVTSRSCNFLARIWQLFSLWQSLPSLRTLHGKLLHYCGAQVKNNGMQDNEKLLCPLTDLVILSVTTKVDEYLLRCSYSVHYISTVVWCFPTRPIWGWLDCIRQ